LTAQIGILILDTVFESLKTLKTQSQPTLVILFLCFQRLFSFVFQAVFQLSKTKFMGVVAPDVLQ